MRSYRINIITALFLLTFIVVKTEHLHGCSAFTYKANRDVIAAKSYEWNVGVGVVLSNPRGERLSMPVGDYAPISWEARFGSITFNQYGQFLPNGGMNEAGLVIEVLWLDDTYYPELKDQMPINELQWVQYHLDVCESVDEVIKSLENFAIVPFFGKLHYFVADKSGNTAIIDFIEGKAVISTGENLVCPAITNDTYANSVNYLQTSDRKGGASSSLNRFARLAESLEKDESNKKNEKSVIDESFDLLDKVWVNGWTKWNIVYNMSKGHIYFKTDVAKSIKRLDMRFFDFSPHAVPLYMNLNNFYSGVVNESFTPFSRDINTELMLSSLNLTGVPVKNKDIEILAGYPETIDEVQRFMIERAANHGTIIVTILNLKENHGLVNAGLFNSEETYDKQRPINGGRVRVSDNSATIVFYNVPLRTTYAIGFFHDENSNGKLDTNRLGLPKEPYGFSGKGRKWDSAKFLFDQKNIIITIKPR